MKRDLPTPDQILEELADKVAVQIDRRAPVAFDAALDELVRYHTFLLSLNASSAPDGSPFNYAEVGSGFFPRPPHLEWASQYRRLFERAMDRVGEDSTFIEKLAYVPLKLLRGLTDPEPSPAIVWSILNLGPTLMHRLEGWLTKRTVAENLEGQAATPRVALTGSDRKAYESALPGIVGAWEALLQNRPSFYRWQNKHDVGASERWSIFAKSWQFLSQHLRNTAYMLAVAVWNEDEIGAELFRDALVRWLHNLSYELDEQADLINRRLLYPEVLSLEWPAALRRVEPILPHFLPSPTPHQLFNCILRAAHDDCILLTAALLLFWHMNEKQASDIGGRAAAALLRREMADSDDTIPQASGAASFRSLFLDFLRVDLAGGRFSDKGYGQELDGLVSRLDRMSERRVVPGRVFSPSTLNDRHGLYPSILAILLAFAPSDGDEGVRERVGELAENEPALPDGDRSLRNLLGYLRDLSGWLGMPSAEVRRGAAALRPDVDIDAASAVLKEVLRMASETIEAARLKRLNERPISVRKIEQLRSAIESVLLTPPAEIHSFFHGYRLKSGYVSEDVQVREYTPTRINKGQLVEPPMDSEIGNLTESVATATCRDAATRIWASFVRRPREHLEVESQIQDPNFWRSIETAASRVGPDPVLLISRGEERSVWRRIIYVRADEKPPVTIKRRPREDAGGRYVATIEDIDVYGADFEAGIAWLFSARILKTIAYGPIDGPSRHVQLAVDIDQENRGLLRVRYQQSVEWADQPIIEIKLPASD